MSGPSTFASPGSGLTKRALVDLARRHDVRPRRSLGQHFLADANVARAIARDAGAAPGTRFLEIGAGLGSLSVALAAAGAEVLAVETDPRLIPALEEAVGGLPVRVAEADATRVRWPDLLGEGKWAMASNLPYNVAVPILLDVLEQAPRVDPMVIMVQREVGERLAASPGAEAYGAVSLKVAFHAAVRVRRRLGPTVFWPEPEVESVVLRLDRHPPPVNAPRDELFRLINEGFAQRRKTLGSALVRLGLERGVALGVLDRAGLDRRVRAETLGLEEFARVAEAIRG
ncbi:MAG: 16S rRNA (adenine(1518)-N(6)/adenine(1519)-N(6))-dimethyltransferase RsmA [Actinomycetota bacterium]|nr:16S rRNA (adenine(1518)-N(6)/adenine(1519)-N(6))-dimethyltransferase RsmA [Actinomycetota bacterium]